MTITAAVTSSTQTPQVTLRQISCAPKSLTVGSRGTCRVTLNPADGSGSAELQLSSSSGSIRLPGKAITRRGQSMLEFQVDAVSSGVDVVVSAGLGSDEVKDTVTVAADRSASIQVPGRRSVKYGTELRFPVSTVDPGATISTGRLPAGAVFDANTGEFRWTPDSTQIGTHQIVFGATDPAGGSASASVTVQVDSGGPVVTGVVNAASRLREAACSPGSIATIEGRWLANGATVTDPTGSSLELAGTKVWANGAAVPVLSASDEELNILCPEAVPGSELELVVQTDHGTADPVRTKAVSAAAGLYSLDGSGKGQGRVSQPDTNRTAIIRNYQTAGQPVTAGEQVVSYGTGLGNLTDILLQVGESEVTGAVVTPVPGRPGLYQIRFTIPSIAPGNNIPLLLSGNTPEGSRVSTNTVSIAVEPDSW